MTSDAHAIHGNAICSTDVPMRATQRLKVTTVSTQTPGAHKRSRERQIQGTKYCSNLAKHIYVYFMDLSTTRH